MTQALPFDEVLLPTPASDEVERASRWRARDHHPQLVGVMRQLARLLERHHAVQLEGVEHLPEGPALLVGNHGHLGYETLLFFHAIQRSTGRLPRGLADRWFFRVPLVRDVLVRIGGAYGHPSNARALLGDGHLVVCYPGGAREVLKRRAADRYKLSWEVSRGFIRIARECGVPIVPFAAAGVDDTFDIQGTLDGTGKFLMGHSKYDLPRLSGSYGLPRSVPFLFRFGQAIDVEAEFEAAPHGGEAALGQVHRSVWQRVQDHLDDTVRAWNERHEWRIA